MKIRINKFVALALFLVLGVSVVSAQSIECETGEYFWGISSSYGQYMPIGGTSRYYGLLDSISWNLSAPILVSNKGKGVVSKAPISLKSDSSTIKYEGKEAISKLGGNLRQAYLLAVSKQFTPQGTVPSSEMFKMPSYNTWAGLGTRLSQSSVEEFVNGIISSSLKPGILIINNGWQSYNGSFEFSLQRFNDPKKMIELLHSKGFKVMLEVFPLVSLDCLDFCFFRDSGMLEKNADGSVRILSWYGGYSAILDLSSEKAYSFLSDKLDNLKKTYGVDGFKFDYISDLKDKYLDRIKPWTTLATKYQFNQILSAFKSNNYSSLIGHLAYKKQNWESIQLNIAEALNAGMCSYPFVIADPIGGGFVGGISDSDYNLIVRQAQLQAFFPFMNYSKALWNIMPKELFQIVLNAQNLHEKLLPYIMELANSAATSGEPIVRSMEYNFPGKGFYDCTDQFMLGNRYLVAPVFSPDNTRTIRLPAGTWIDDYGKKIKGPAVVKVNVPIDRILYFKASKDIKIK